MVDECDFRGEPQLRIQYTDTETNQSVNLVQGPRNQLDRFEPKAAPKVNVNEHEVALADLREGSTIAFFATGQSSQGDEIVALAVASSDEAATTFIEALEAAE
jgi:hypothetical protein